LRPDVTVFLAGSECPFTCVFCDLWRYTLDGPTPAGALPAQLDRALAEVGALPEGAGIKLYNASNFFDARAVPPGDLPAIAARLASFRRVIVECHPRLVDDRCLEFADRLDAALEVGMGLETIHPEAAARLNKSMTLGEFERAASFLGRNGIGLRAFVLVGALFLAPEEAAEWAVRSVDHALRLGAGVVALIPARGGNGEMDRLARYGEFTPPTLRLFEEAAERSVALGRGVVLADLWDVERLEGCGECSGERIARLKRMNRDGRVPAPVACPRCAPE
jgi:radical SAM enzyme (TIGR01210 family)